MNDIDDGNTDKLSPPWLLKVKASIRPVLTYLFTFLYIYAFIYREHLKDVYISGLNTIMVTIIIFWFGERLMRNSGITDFLKSYAPKLNNGNNVAKEE